MNRKLSVFTGTVQVFGRFICILQRSALCRGGVTFRSPGKAKVSGLLSGLLASLGPAVQMGRAGANSGD